MMFYKCTLKVDGQEVEKKHHLRNVLVHQNT